MLILVFRRGTNEILMIKAISLNKWIRNTGLKWKKNRKKCLKIESERKKMYWRKKKQKKKFIAKEKISQSEWISSDIWSGIVHTLTCEYFPCKYYYYYHYFSCIAALFEKCKMNKELQMLQILQICRYSMGYYVCTCISRSLCDEFVEGFFNEIRRRIFQLQI